MNQENDILANKPRKYPINQENNQLTNLEAKKLTKQTEKTY